VKKKQDDLSQVGIASAKVDEDPVDEIVRDDEYLFLGQNTDLTAISDFSQGCVRFRPGNPPGDANRLIIIALWLLSKSDSFKNEKDQDCKDAGCGDGNDPGVDDTADNPEV
jgi:hypothetical protein